jgi:hypothetical protein
LPVDKICIPANVLITKRLVLSFIAHCFDPLDFVTPLLVSAKLIFQELWKLNIAWDIPIPDVLYGLFHRWLLDLKKILSFRVPRCFGGSPWRSLENIELHAFGYASQKR